MNAKKLFPIILLVIILACDDDGQGNDGGVHIDDHGQGDKFTTIEEKPADWPTAVLESR